MRSSAVTLALALALRSAEAIHWPGFGHGQYAVGEVLPLRVAKLWSMRTQVPFSFYSLAQCSPAVLTPSAENLGEVLHGDRILNAPWDLRLREPRFLALCRISLDPSERAEWVERIRDEYRAHLLLDNLPVATRLPPRRAGGTRLDRGPGAEYERGYRLGTMRPDGSATVHNHLHFTVQYHEGGGGGARIVGFEVEVGSRAYTHTKKWPDDFEGPDGNPCEVLNLQAEAVGLSWDGDAPMILAPPTHGRAGRRIDLVLTYNVTYVPSDVPFSSRWDVYLRLDEGSQVHWLSLCGSLALSLLLASLVAAIMVSTVRRDLRKYNAVELDDELAEVTVTILLYSMYVFR